MSFEINHEAEGIAYIAFHRELMSLEFGKVTLECCVHDGHPKFRIIKETSIMPGKATSGSQGSYDI
ncbi:MAG: hypothetical protein LBU88_05555 [Treponema sp.]|jgi:hypothetical protein|nr:hypothetical protein [Treponema sp.]